MTNRKARTMLAGIAVLVMAAATGCELQVEKPVKQEVTTEIVTEIVETETDAEDALFSVEETVEINESEQPSETEAATEHSTETVSEEATEKVSESGIEYATESAAESMTESITEAPESYAEIVTESITEAPESYVEIITEADTDLPLEEVTESAAEEIEMGEVQQPDIVIGESGQPDIVEDFTIGPQEPRALKDDEYASLIAGNLTKEEFTYLLAVLYPFESGYFETSGWQLNFLVYSDLIAEKQSEVTGYRILPSLNPDGHGYGMLPIDELNRFCRAFTAYQFAPDRQDFGYYGTMEGNTITFDPGDAAWTSYVSSVTINAARYTQDKIEVWFHRHRTCVNPEMHNPDLNTDEKATLLPLEDGTYRIDSIVEEALPIELVEEKTTEEITIEPESQQASTLADEDYASVIAGHLTKDELQFVLASLGTDTVNADGTLKNGWQQNYLQMAFIVSYQINETTGKNYIQYNGYNNGYISQGREDINRYAAAFTDFIFTEENSGSGYEGYTAGDSIYCPPVSTIDYFEAVISQTRLTPEKLEIWYRYRAYEPDNAAASDYVRDLKATLLPLGDGTYRISAITEETAPVSEEAASADTGEPSAAGTVAAADSQTDEGDDHPEPEDGFETPDAAAQADSYDQPEPEDGYTDSDNAGTGDSYDQPEPEIGEVTADSTTGQTGAAATAGSLSKDALSAYNTLLDQFQSGELSIPLSENTPSDKNDNGEEYEYFLYDITGDGEPELFISRRYISGGVFIMNATHIYTAKETNGTWQAEKVNTYCEGALRPDTLLIFLLYKPGDRNGLIEVTEVSRGTGQYNATMLEYDATTNTVTQNGLNVIRTFYISDGNPYDTEAEGVTWTTLSDRSPLQS